MKLPKHWKDVTVGDCCSIRHGYAFEGSDMTAQATEGPIVVSIGNLQYTGGFRFGSTTLKRATIDPPKGYVLQPGEVLVAMTCQTPDGEILGIPGMIPSDGRTYLHNQRLGLVVTKEEVPTSKSFLFYLFCSKPFNRHLVERATGTKVKHTSPTTIESFEFALPPLPEQRKIADILSTWDEALEKLDALIEAQERRKKALMQQLLTGRRRLKGFDQSKGKTASDRFGIYPADWKRVRLGEITHEVPTKNAEGTDLPVLSCTKHRGLVLSQEYFGKRVYAEDTSGYRVVQRGEFAYATNHIEEGSIGYQNLCDAGLVSPIYTVFKTTEAVDDSYLFRVLKSTLLIHLYQINTSASVDRRGSLRYDEFSRIHIWLPGKEEQTAIAQVFDTADQQLTLLRTQRTALDQQKRGLMQRLLTGKLRVKT